MTDAHADAMDATMHDSGGDVAPDNTVSDASDASNMDAHEAAVDAGPPQPLQMCPVLDNEYLIASDAAGCAMATGSSCPDRVSNWGGDFMAYFLDGPAVTDCKIHDMFTQLAAINGGGGFSDYQAQVTYFGMAIFGCPTTLTDAGLGAFGLIPGDITGHVYTTADLDLLASYYAQAVQAALMNPCADPLYSTCTTTPTGPLPPLTVGDGGTQGQLDLLNANMEYQESQVMGVVTSSVYSFSTCTNDAGTDAPTDAGGGG